MNLQRTLKQEVKVVGIGVHSGKEAQLTIQPGRPNQGIIFKRIDIEGSPEIPAHFTNVVNTKMATTLGRGTATISTVEHVMAALALTGIDNAILEVNGPEVPIMDGSSEPFAVAIIRAGFESQLPTRSIVVLRRRVELKLDGKWAVAEPSSRLEIHGTIDWDHPAIGHQEYHYVEGRTTVEDIAKARTFGFLKDVEALKRMGLARGGSLDNAVVLDDAQILNPSGLRYPNEFARHKVLDALGDFKLAGVALQAHIRLHRAGHDVHSQLLAEIFRDADNFELIGGTGVEERQPQPARVALRAAFGAV
jgi:UDP-3-O-[3-hydroxymyristoyl] N-acetylglucosamine deacetylase